LFGSAVVVAVVAILARCASSGKGGEAESDDVEEKGELEDEIECMLGCAFMWSICWPSGVDSGTAGLFGFGWLFQVKLEEALGLLVAWFGVGLLLLLLLLWLGGRDDESEASPTGWFLLFVK